MAWFRLDDNGYDHTKVLNAGDRAYGVWCRAGQYCSNKKTDGFVSEAASRRLCGDKRVWAKLVEVGLLDTADGGYTIHDFLVYNPSREELDAKAKAKSEAGKSGVSAKRTRRDRRESGADRERIANGSRTNQDRMRNGSGADCERIANGLGENGGQVCVNIEPDPSMCLDTASSGCLTTPVSPSRPDPLTYPTGMGESVPPTPPLPRAGRCGARSAPCGRMPPST